MADRFEDLRNYVAVVDNGGVNAAAQALGIAKSAVSRRLGELETRLGVTLVERGSRKLQLTATGRDYHLRAKGLLASLDELDRSISGEATKPAELTLEIPPELGSGAFSRSLTSFCSANPEVSLRLTASCFDDGKAADLRLTTNAISPGESLQLGSFTQVLCAAPAYVAQRGSPASKIDLVHHSVIMIEGQPRHPSDSLREGAQATITAMDADGAASLAIAGGGIAQLPDFVIKEAIAEDRLVPVLTEQARTMILNVAFAPDATAFVRRLADHLARTIALRR